MLKIGKRDFSWNSTKFRLAGIKSQKITKISFGEKLTSELVRAMTRDGVPIGVTSGEYEADVMTISMLISEWTGSNLLNPGYLSLLTLGKSVGLADVDFDVELQFFEEVENDLGGGVVTIAFPRCRVEAQKSDNSKGTTASEWEISVKVIEPIQTNGTQLASVIRSFALI